MVITLAGVNVSALVRLSTIRGTDRLNDRNSMSFALRDALGGFTPCVGQTVALALDGTAVFAGRISRLQRDRLGQFEIYRLECVSYDGTFDRYIVSQVYETTGQTAGEIVRDLIANYCVSDGITVANVADGPVVFKALFPYLGLASALDELAMLAGFSWWVDENKDLHFCARNAISSPWSVSDSNPEDWEKLQIQETLETYRNRQIIRAGYDKTDTRVEVFAGDGKRKVFTAAYPVSEVPSAITVDAVSKTVGIRGLEEGKDWYWNKGDKEITQDDGGTALTSAQVLSVSYKGYFPIVIAEEDSAEVAARATIEGGTGIYEHIIDDPNIDNSNMAEEKANALLARYGDIPERLSFVTRRVGLRAGQLLTVAVASRGLSSATWLIEEVTFQWCAGNVYTWAVRVASGEGIGTWVDFFRKLVAAGRKFAIRESEVFTMGRTITGAVNCAEALTYVSAAPESRAGYAYVGEAEVA